MKRFLIKLCLFVLPVVLVATAMELTLRSIPNNYAYKHEYLKRHASEIEVLVLGSSHGVYNINPDYISGRAFNAAHLSQSFKYDYYIFDRFKPQFSNLKSVWIPVHYRSLFYELEDDPEHWRENYYSIYYGCDYHASPLRRLELFTAHPTTLIKRFAKNLRSKGKMTLCNVTEAGFGLIATDADRDPLEESGLWTAQRHTTHDYKHLENNYRILDKLIAECRELDVEVVLFSPPVYRSYAENWDAAQLDIMQTRIAGLLSQHSNVHYHNFFLDERFGEADFLDSDHLNGPGAKKLTVLVDALMIGTAFN